MQRSECIRSLKTPKASLLAVVLVSAIAQTAGEPIPDSWLKNGRLVAPEFNFSIGSPQPNCRWTLERNVGRLSATTIVGDVSANERYLVSVLRKTVGNGTLPVDPKAFLAGMQKSLPPGWTTEDVHAASSATPTIGSEKLKVQLKLPDHSRVYAYVYIVPGKLTYMLEHLSSDPNEPHAFVDLARSFAFISPADNVIPRTSESSPVSGLLLLGALGGAVQDWRYKRRGGVKPSKKDRVSVLILCLTWLAAVVALRRIGASAESLGSATASFALMLFAVWEAGRFYIRRKHPVQLLEVGQSPMNTGEV